jgi:DNA-binding transcriptional ArsR family regulator
LTLKRALDAPGTIELAKAYSPSETSWKRLLWYTLAGSRGGINRGRIINLLRQEPRNINQLAEALGVHYRVAEHHIRALEKNNLVSPSGDRYGRLYFLSQEMEAHLYLFDEVWQKMRSAALEVKK